MWGLLLYPYSSYFLPYDSFEKYLETAGATYQESNLDRDPVSPSSSAEWWARDGMSHH